jgi:hypothetical protein
LVAVVFVSCGYLAVRAVIVIIAGPSPLTSISVSSIIDMDMPFGYLRIGIPGPAIMEVDKYKDSKDDLETKKEGSNPYSTRTLVNLSPVAYIKPGRGAPRGTTYNIRYLIDIEYHRHAILEIQDRLDR